jgi:16S rRNA processing protein RimM
VLIMLQRDETVCVGHILGAQGVKGEVRVFSNTDPRENIVTYSPWLVEVDGQIETIEVKGRLQGKNVIAHLTGVEDRGRAIELVGSKIYISPDQLPKLDDNEFYWSDLIGMEVKSLQDEALGTIESMMETGASDVMVLRGDKERLIPFVMEDIVREIDIVNKQMIVDWQADY